MLYKYGNPNRNFKYNLKGKKSATYFWPGSDVLHVEEERKPNFFLKYDKTNTFQMRVEQILDWISLPVNERPALLTMYFDEPDITGHNSGPTSANVKQTCH